MIKKFYMILSLVAGVAVGASDPVRAVESSLDLSQTVLTANVRVVFERGKELVNLRKRPPRIQVPFLLADWRKIAPFAYNQGVCISLSAQWLSSIRQNETPDQGIEVFINGLRRIAGIHPDIDLNDREMADLSDFCQKTKALQDNIHKKFYKILNNNFIALRKGWDNANIQTGCSKRLTENSLKLSVLGEQPWQCQLVLYDFNRLLTLIHAFSQNPSELQMIVVNSYFFDGRVDTIKKAQRIKLEDLPEYGLGVGLHFDPSTTHIYYYGSNDVAHSLGTHGVLWVANKLWHFNARWDNFPLGAVTQCMIMANAPIMASFVDGQEEWLGTLDDAQCVQRAMNQKPCEMLLLYAIRGVCPIAP